MLSSFVAVGKRTSMIDRFLSPNITQRNDPIISPRSLRTTVCQEGTLSQKKRYHVRWTDRISIKTWYPSPIIVLIFHKSASTVLCASTCRIISKRTDISVTHRRSGRPCQFLSCVTRSRRRRACWEERWRESRRFSVEGGGGGGGTAGSWNSLGKKYRAASR